MKNRKNIGLIIAIVFILTLITGAAYAYFTTSVINNFSSKYVNATVADKGYVTLNKTGNGLSLNLSAVNMKRQVIDSGGGTMYGTDIVYYATDTGVPSTSVRREIIGTAVTTGEAYYTCDYTISATASGTNNMYTAFQGMTGKSKGQIVLTIGNREYDFNTTNLFPLTATGKIYNVTSSNPGYIRASLAIVNKADVLQNALAGTDISISLTVTSFTCESSAEPLAVPNEELRVIEIEGGYSRLVNVSQTDLSKNSGYTKSLSCNPNYATWDDKYQRIVFNNTNHYPENCSLIYTQDTADHSSNYLTTTISNLLGASTQVTSGNGILKNEGTAGIRYEGINPNNYVWFNNEMWRIIGIIPTCTASGCSTSENLVKIIRDEPIGGIAYDAKTSDYTGEWGSNTLYSLLNSYYYGKRDGTDTEYCYGDQNVAKIKCDYRVKGISNNVNDFYGSMVQNVYWNTGASNSSARATAYTNEKGKQTVNGEIGLMNISDYGYGASTNGNAGTNWLYNDGYTWTNTQNSSVAGTARRASVNGVADYFHAYAGFAVKPVVYLDSTVYVVSGDGTESTPYQMRK